MRRKTQITIETHSITIIRTSGTGLTTYCERGGEAVAAFTPDQFTAVLQKSMTEILSLIETGDLHITKPVAPSL